MPAETMPLMDFNSQLSDLGTKAKAWTFEEARRLVKRYQRVGYPPEILFETGYGPSGLPHIGTFGEVVRTTMVRHAFRVLTEDKVPTRLLCFSDDMDGFRKVPTNIPNQEMMASHIGKPLSQVPDPYSDSGSGEYESFADHNNARLRSFLDRFGFEYEFASATQYYKSGRFDETLLKLLEVYDDVMNIILPTLGPERRQTYSPFLPICQRTGIVLQVPTVERNIKAGTIVYEDPETGKNVETPVTGGNVKCQWKADWAMRWAALGVDYEMAGKDLIESVKLSGKICRALGKNPPEGFSYELFLDETGQKISKSKGNGLIIDDWLGYAPAESLSLFMYQKPKSAKRLFFDVIPRHVDDYFKHLAAYDAQEIEGQLQNPVWHIHSGNPPKADMPITFSMLLNLVSASNSVDKLVLWGFIGIYGKDITPQTHPKLDELVGYAIAYFEDFVKPNKTFRAPNDKERAAMQALYDRLGEVDSDSDGDQLQTEIFSIGKAHDFENLREWFQALYQVLLGQDQGPRFGSFTALYGIEPTRKLIKQGLAGKFLS